MVKRKKSAYMKLSKEFPLGGNKYYTEANKK